MEDAHARSSVLGKCSNRSSGKNQTSVCCCERGCCHATRKGEYESGGESTDMVTGNEHPDQHLSIVMRSLEHDRDICFFYKTFNRTLWPHLGSEDALTGALAPLRTAND